MEELDDYLPTADKGSDSHVEELLLDNSEQPSMEVDDDSLIESLPKVEVVQMSAFNSQTVAYKDAA